MGVSKKRNIALLFLFNRWEGSEAQREQGNVQRLSRRKWEGRDENQGILVSKCSVLFSSFHMDLPAVASLFSMSLGGLNNTAYYPLSEQKSFKNKHTCGDWVLFLKI